MHVWGIEFGTCLRCFWVVWEVCGEVVRSYSEEKMVENVNQHNPMEIKALGEVVSCAISCTPC